MIRMLLGCFILFVVLCAFAEKGQMIKYQVKGKAYEGYYIAGVKNAPLVLLVHDWDGLNEYEILRSGSLADKGYAVFAADLFGAGNRPSTIEERKKLTSGLYNNRPLMLALLRGALDAAKKQGAHVNKAVAMGYCFGGSAVLELARSGENFKGFVTFHGGLEIPTGQDYSKTKGSILVFHGSADKSVSMEQFAALATALESAGVSHEMIAYGGADHAFSVFGGERYNKDADAKSWARFLGFLETNLKKQKAEQK